MFSPKEIANLVAKRDGMVIAFVVGIAILFGVLIGSLIIRAF